MAKIQIVHTSGQIFTLNEPREEFEKTIQILDDALRSEGDAGWAILQMAGKSLCIPLLALKQSIIVVDKDAP